MTQPTQAQIEALKAIRHWTLKQPDTVWYDEITTLHDLCEQALAAAQVGDNEVSYSEKDLVEIISANIERCAQVAEEHLKTFGGAAPIIAAAIRKLKDRP